MARNVLASKRRELCFCDQSGVGVLSLVLNIA
jgi:hypothetical protein